MVQIEGELLLLQVYPGEGCVCVCFFMNQIWVNYEQGLAGRSLRYSQALEEGKQRENTRFLAAEEIGGCSNGVHLSESRELQLRHHQL